MSDETIPWWEPRLGAPVRDAVQQVLDDDYINDGPVTRALEARIAEIAGVEYGVATSSCTTALAISLIAAGVGHGDEVIVPDITFIATASAVKLAGAEVKLVDVDAARLTISVERVIAAVGPATKAVIAVDFNGRAADYAALEDVCQERGLVLICDSAEALGSRCDGRAMGSYGAAGCFSFSAHKIVFAGQGGVAVTDDAAFHARLRDLRDHARREEGPFRDVMYASVGFNFKYPNLLAAVAVAQLDELDERLSHAKTRDRWYRELLHDCPGVSFPGEPQKEGEACLWADIFADDQETLIKAFGDNGIGFRRFFLPLHRQDPYRQPDDAFPNAIEAWKKGVWLPCALSLTHGQAQRVAEICRQAGE